VPDSARLFLDTLFRDTITALHPAAAVRDALDVRDRASTPTPATHLIGIGKAAPAMCAAALEWFREHQRTVTGGVCIAHDTGGVSVAPLPMILGDHPVPGAKSHHAAAALGAYIEARVQPGDAVLVLLSGGASAVIGAPRAGMSAAEYDATVAALIASGLSVQSINAQRRTLSRWGGGQLGMALTAEGATVDVLLISDVIGDDLASVGSGPCVLPAGTAHTPIVHRVISNNAAARAALVALAAARGAIASQVQEPLQGDVLHCADRIALALRTFASTARTGTVSQLPRVICWGGEPTVTLPGPDAPPGGRMQALALLIAKQLRDAGSDSDGITVLAAGTDGRDGPTSAAGAVVDGRTWAAMRAAGRSPEVDLATFHAHDALRTVHATLPEFVSGTNVNDLVIAMIARTSG
jgi:glycerate 2-kinase